ncbi:MAG: thiamine pyrophosphate-binding protein [Steroidobacteraceae bacterium]
MRVADAIAKWFEIAGFRHYFGYAGGSVWPLLDALIETPQIEAIQAKHESHAVHMADLYTRVSGTIAPVIVNKGPGLLNAVGACASAMHDSCPLLIIAGGPATHFLGKAGMQEIFYHGSEDASSVFKPVTKATWMVVRPDTTIDLLNFALKTAVSGRPGPVFLQVPFDIQLSGVEGEIEAPAVRLPIAGASRAGLDEVRAVVDLLAQAQRPLLLAGGGIVRSKCAPALRSFAEAHSIPVVTTMPAKGILSEDHPLSLGTVGRSGFECAARASREADLIIAIGARFSDNNTANWRRGSIYDIPKTKIVQIDVDYSEVGRNYAVALGIVGDAKCFLEDLLKAAAEFSRGWPEWLARVQGYRQDWERELVNIQTSATRPIHPARLVHEVGKALPADGRVFIDIGDVTQYAEAYMKIRTPGSWQISPGMAEMGWAASGILGAVAADRRGAIALVGDGAFNMVCQVVATAVEYDLPAVWVILNNYGLGIERKGMEKAYKRSHPWCHFRRKDTHQPYNPDYVGLARAFGAEAARIEDPDELQPALQRALASRRPWVLDVPTDDSVGSYFTKGIDRAYPDNWSKSYPNYNLLRNAPE